MVGKRKFTFLPTVEAAKAQTMIPHKTVEQILDTVRIEEVVRDFVPLKRRGVNLIGLCPFHAEKTPSFTVAPSKNIFKCFGCGKGGTAVTFLMEHEGLSYPEALRYLARRYNIEIEEVELTPEMLAQRQEQESLFILNDFARQFYEDQLFRSDIGRSVGLAYFKERGFREETIRKFQLGFAPDEPDLLTRTALDKGYKREYLEKLGLTNRHGKDFFRNRVIFTIHNLSGKPVAFAGRILKKDPKAPKYINSPETDIYTKSKVLYGISFAKKAIQQQDECILVEGYTDVISLHQAGIENVVASSGTALTEGQIALIRRFTPNIKILYDGDPAGIKAAMRGLDLVLEQDMNVRIVLLPEGEDPDSYLQRVGAEAFKTYIHENAKDFILFKTDLLLAEAQGDPVKKAALLSSIVDSIARIRQTPKRIFYIQECARVMGIDESVLIIESNKVVRRLLEERKRQRARSEGTQVHVVSEEQSTAAQEATTGHIATPASAQHFKERDLVRLLVAFGDQIYAAEDQITVAEYILSYLEELLDNFESEDYKHILKLALERLQNGLHVDTQFFIGHVDERVSTLAVDLLHQPWEYSKGWEERGLFLHSQKKPEENYMRDVDSALNRYLLQIQTQLCKENQERIRKMQEAGRHDELMRLLRVQAKLLQKRNEMAQRLGTVVLNT